jgi:hypothetical protein
MGIVTKDRPTFEWLKVFTSYPAWLSTAITAVAFILSNQELTVWSAIITIVIIVALAYLIYLIVYATRYLRYLLETERNHGRLMQLYGEKESQLVERDRIISSYPKQLIENFRRGAMRGVAAMLSSKLLSDLGNKDIGILEKVAGNTGVELIFNVGKTEGVSRGMLLSIVTAYSNDLWGIVRIVEVDENRCRGEVISKINLDFWRKMEKEMYSDVSPPPHLKARLYTLEDLDTELGLMEGKSKEKGD